MPVPLNLPEKAKNTFESVMEGLKGKKNPRTGKSYTDEERAKIAWSAVKRKYKKEGDGWVEKSYSKFGIMVSVKSNKTEGGYFFEGYLSTPRLDNSTSQKDGTVGDVCTWECIMDMNNQLKNGSFKGSYLHDAVLEKDMNKMPLSRLVNSEVDVNGLKIMGMLNPMHQAFEKAQRMMNDGFLDGLSIEYYPEKFRKIDKDGKMIRLLDKVKVLGYGHTPRPSNEDCTLINVFKKSIDEADDIEDVEPEVDEKSIGGNDIEDMKMMKCPSCGHTGDEREFKMTNEMNSQQHKKSMEEEIMAETKTSPPTGQVSTTAEAKAQPDHEAEIKALKEQLEAKAKELEEIRTKAKDDETLKQVKSIVAEEIKNLKPQSKVLFTEEEVKTMDFWGILNKIEGVN